MRVKTPKFFLLLLLATAVLVGTGEAVASTFEATIPGFVHQGPDERLQEWQHGLMDFLDQHPDLNSEQLVAIQDLAELDDRSLLEASLEPASREIFAQRLGAAGQVLSYWDYLQLLRSFSDEFRVWLVENQLATAVEADTPECNCDSSQDCNGGTCRDVTCIHVGGTSHKGRC